eukprot:TRINITY_DN1685_c0_g1_i6.p1 TRINITY_DN1685_c0_g1~~TRINITY_DN1685_c0_g1_i6.p1  ORF type:complete len:392 (+),score=83.44 TRINITY_DN1685_c0_g1_i6:130-1305(+)
MFGLMRNFYRWVKKKNEKSITLCLLGLDNAGKTTTLHRIKGEVPENITPTWGFMSEEMNHGKHKLTLFDLGGGKNIRGIWQNYYAEVHGVIFVVDSAAADRLGDACTSLHKALTSPNLDGKPVLILANKQDLPQALKADEIAKQLKLHEIPNLSYRILGCSALKTEGNLHMTVFQGTQWLVSTISSKYDQLSERVARESAEQKERERIEQEEKKKRVEAAREERRRKQEAEEAAAAAAAAANPATSAQDEKANTQTPASDAASKPPMIVEKLDGHETKPSQEHGDNLKPSDSETRSSGGKSHDQPQVMSLQDANGTNSGAPAPKTSLPDVITSKTGHDARTRLPPLSNIPNASPNRDFNLPNTIPGPDSRLSLTATPDIENTQIQPLPPTA